MKRTRAIVLAVLMSSAAYADELRYIPKWTMCGDKACYDFDQAKKLLEIDADLHKLTLGQEVQTDIGLSLKKATKNLQEALERQKEAAEKLQLNNTKLNELLIKETTRANQAEARSGPFPAWAIAGGIGIGVGIIAGIILGVYVAK
jgi:hypothetical protein